MSGTRLACLDKDGTLLENLPYNVDPAAMRLSRGASTALALLHEAGFRLVVISNQPGVALGRFPESALQAVASRLTELCAAAGGPLSGFYYCPHAEADGCACRKPQPALLKRALDEHQADAAQSWMVGDILDDIEAGRRAGCRTVMIDNGNETEWLPGPNRRPDHIVNDLADAARFITGTGGTRRVLAEVGS